MQNTLSSSRKIFYGLSIFGLFFSKEIPVQDIPLSGIITNPKQEISGMDLYQDQVILLPENLGGYLFMISKDEIYASLNSKSPAAIEPKQIPFLTPDYSKSIPGFEGLESIAFDENHFIITLEAKSDGDMHGYVAWGTIDPKTFEAVVLEQDLIELPMPTQVKNMTYESALIYKNDAILFYEANGKNIRKSAWQHQFSLKEKTTTKIAFPNIEYRITDVTKLDEQNRFWAINYLWPGDKKRLTPSEDQIAINYKKGKTHQQSEAIERLVAFEIKNGEIHLANLPPVQFELDEDGSRNWEGIVRLDKKGFLIATDKFPGSFLSFVPYRLK